MVHVPRYLYVKYKMLEYVELYSINKSLPIIAPILMAQFLKSKCAQIHSEKFQVRL